MPCVLAMRWGGGVRATARGGRLRRGRLRGGVGSKEDEEEDEEEDDEEEEEDEDEEKEEEGE